MTWSELSLDTCRRQVRKVAEGSAPFRYTNIQFHFSRRCFRLRIEQICGRAPSFETNFAASSRVSGSAQTSTSDICVLILEEQCKRNISCCQCANIRVSCKRLNLNVLCRHCPLLSPLLGRNKVIPVRPPFAVKGRN